MYMKENLDPLFFGYHINSLSVARLAGRITLGLKNII